VREPRLARFRGPCLAFAAFLVVQAVSAAALFATKIGPGPARVRTFYLGDAAAFAAPRTLAGLLEVAVPHLAAIPLVLFAVAHVVAFARALGPRALRALSALSFGSAALGIVVGFGVRYVSPALAWVKIGAFGGLEAALLAWASFLVLAFVPFRAPALAPPRSTRAPVEEVAK
jgi:hypothetical protein